MKFKRLINVLVKIGSLAGSVVISAISGKYLIAGVTAERGYEAAGGEYIFIAVIFVCIYYTLSRLILSAVNEMFVD